MNLIIMADMMKIALVLIFSLAVSMARECSIDLKGDFKTEPEYLFFGETLDLICTIKDTPQVNASSIFIKSWNGTLLETSSLFENSTVKMMYAQDNVEIYMVKPVSQYLGYKCIYKESRCETKIGDTMFVVIDSKPQKVTNGSCVVYNWESMICTWDLGVVYRNKIDSEVSVAYKNITDIDFRDLDYDVSLKWSVFQNLSPCPNQRITDGKCLTCEFTKDQGRDSYRTMQYVFVIHINNNKRNITVTSDFHFNTLDFVQPAKVYNVAASTDKTSLNLSWHHSKPFRNIQYHVQYKSEWEDEWEVDTLNQEVTDVFEIKKSYAEHNIVLEGLTPYTKYDIRISCIPMNFDSEIKGFWSEAYQIEAKTKEDVPIAVPTLLPSFFHCGASCNILQIYWKPIRKELRRCKEIRYKIQLNETTTRPVLYKPDGAVSANIEIDPTSTTTIYLTQYNDRTGGNPRINPSSIMILPKHKRPALPSDLTVITDNSTGQNVSLTWTYPPELAVIPFSGEFVVFWCKGNQETKCQREINWKIIPERSQYNINVSVDEIDDYIFGVSAEGYYAGVRSSSGIKWAECVFITNQIPKEPLTVIPVMEEMIDDSMKIKWRPYSCEEFRGHIILYIISYCKNDACDETMVSLNITGNLTSYDLKNLTPGKYSVWLIPESDGGKGPRSEVVNFSIFSQDLPADDSTTMLTIIIITIVLIILATLIGLVILWRKFKVRLDNDTKIEVPLISTVHEDQSGSPTDSSGRGSTIYSSGGRDTNTGTSAGSGDSGIALIQNPEPSNTNTHENVINDTDTYATGSYQPIVCKYGSSTVGKGSFYRSSDESRTQCDEIADNSLEEEFPLLERHYSIDDICEILKESDDEKTNPESGSGSSAQEYSRAVLHNGQCSTDTGDHILKNSDDEKTNSESDFDSSTPSCSHAVFRKGQHGNNMSDLDKKPNSKSINDSDYSRALCVNDQYSVDISGYVPVDSVYNFLNDTNGN